MLKRRINRKIAKIIHSYSKKKTPITIESQIMDCKTVIVEKNKEVVIEKFYQWKTYENLLCGLPSNEANLGFIEDLKERAKEYFSIDSFYLIEPEQKPIYYPFEWPYEPWKLPKVSCLVQLYCSESGQMGLVISQKRLVIGWFQDDFTFPSNSDILAKIKKIPWSTVASNVEWEDY